MGVISMPEKYEMYLPALFFPLRMFDRFIPDWPGSFTLKILTNYSKFTCELEAIRSLEFSTDE